MALIFFCPTGWAATTAGCNSVEFVPNLDHIPVLNPNFGVYI